MYGLRQDDGLAVNMCEQQQARRHRRRRRPPPSPLVLLSPLLYSEPGRTNGQMPLGPNALEILGQAHRLVLRWVNVLLREF